MSKVRATMILKNYDFEKIWIFHVFVLKKEQIFSFSHEKSTKILTTHDLGYVAKNTIIYFLPSSPSS